MDRRYVKGVTKIVTHDHIRLMAMPGVDEVWKFGMSPPLAKHPMVVLEWEEMEWVGGGDGHEEMVIHRLYVDLQEAMRLFREVATTITEIEKKERASDG